MNVRNGSKAGSRLMSGMGGKRTLARSTHAGMIFYLCDPLFASAIEGVAPRSNHPAEGGRGLCAANVGPGVRRLPIIDEAKLRDQCREARVVQSLPHARIPE